MYGPNDAFDDDDVGVNIAVASLFVGSKKTGDVVQVTVFKRQR